MANKKRIANKDVQDAQALLRSAMEKLSKPLATPVHCRLEMIDDDEDRKTYLRLTEEVADYWAELLIEEDDKQFIHCNRYVDAVNLAITRKPQN